MNKNVNDLMTNNEAIKILNNLVEAGVFFENVQVALIKGMCALDEAQKQYDAEHVPGQRKDYGALDYIFEL